MSGGPMIWFVNVPGMLGLISFQDFLNTTDGLSVSPVGAGKVMEYTDVLLFPSDTPYMTESISVGVTMECGRSVFHSSTPSATRNSPTGANSTASVAPALSAMALAPATPPNFVFFFHMTLP